MREETKQIWDLIRERKAPQVREALAELSDNMDKMDSYEEFFNKVKKLVREKGKTDFIKKQEIEELIVKYGGNEDEN